jgi:hypothetical protein
MWKSFREKLRRHQLHTCKNVDEPDKTPELIFSYSYYGIDKNELHNIYRQNKDTFFIDRPKNFSNK